MARNKNLRSRGAAWSRHWWSALFGSLLIFAGCGGVATPDPKLAARELVTAVQRKDGGAVHAMLDEASRRRVTVEEVQALLERDGPEITRRVKADGSVEVQVRADAVLPGGERLTLTQDSDEYRVDESSALMGFAVTPHEALIGLRRALEHPDYVMLLQLLSSDVREQVESRREALVQALSDLGALEVVVQGEQAVVNTADGHRVELELESGVWRISDFE